MSQLVTVVPCYNEAERLDIDAFVVWISESPDTDFIFVNDGSRDSTAEILDSLRSRFPNRISILTLDENKGKAEAVRLGIQAALNENPAFVAFWDADLATPLDEIERFLEIFRTGPGLEVVIGSRVKLLGRQIERNMWRHYLGRFFATLVSLLLRLEIYDTQCGAKMFRAGALIQTAMSQPFQTRWLFDVEILARYIEAHPDGLLGVRRCVYELPVNSWKDIRSPSLTPSAYLRAAFSLLSIIKVYRSGLRRAARIANKKQN